MNSVRVLIELFAPGEGNTFYSVMIFFLIASGFEQICAYLYSKLTTNEYFKHHKQMSHKSKDDLIEEGKLVDAYNQKDGEADETLDESSGITTFRELCGQFK
jgi:hypothetical protein